jgi:ribosomal protein L19E
MKITKDQLREMIREALLDEKKKKKKRKKRKVKRKKRKLTSKPGSESNLGDWFGRKGAPGSKSGWVDCNTCRKDKKTGRKK